MWLLVLEALAALALLIFIVAWTMSGRRRDVTPPEEPPAGEEGGKEGPPGPR